MLSTLVGAWRLPYGSDLDGLIENTHNWFVSPDLGLQICLSIRDTLFATVLFGEASLERGKLLFLEDRGVYEILRCDLSSVGQVLLMLLAHAGQ
jgi:hypothetical protein